jgi:hypothetical protein
VVDRFDQRDLRPRPTLRRGHFAAAAKMSYPRAMASYDDGSRRLTFPSKQLGGLRLDEEKVAPLRRWGDGLQQQSESVELRAADRSSKCPLPNVEVASPV